MSDAIDKRQSDLKLTAKSSRDQAQKDELDLGMSSDSYQNDIDERKSVNLASIM